MIKFIIFDLDGVLVETKDIHFKALNKALMKTKKKISNWLYRSFKKIRWYTHKR